LGDRGDLIKKLHIEGFCFVVLVVVLAITKQSDERSQAHA